MGLDLSGFDNRFKVEFGSDGKCKECGMFHKLNVEDKLIADCNGNFNPGQHKAYINRYPVQEKDPLVLARQAEEAKSKPVAPVKEAPVEEVAAAEDNSAVLGVQTIAPQEIKTSPTSDLHDWEWAMTQIEAGKKVCQAEFTNKGLYLAKLNDADSRVIFFQNGLPNGPENQGVELTHMRAKDWRIWRSAEDVKLNCKLDGNALHIYGEGFENLQESPSMFVKLNKKQLKEFKELQESLQ